MTHARLAKLAATFLVVGLEGTTLQAQGLERRIAAAAGTAAQFHFPARAGVCGDGRTFIRLDHESWYGSMNDYTRLQPCEAGPVRVVVVKGGGETLKLETYVGPLVQGPDIVDLGRVPASEAVAYLGSLAQRGEGRVARDAIFPLGIADSAEVTPLLVRLVRDGERPRETRRAALSAIVRRRAARDAMPANDLVALLAEVARNEAEHNNFRQSVVGTLGRLDRGEGIPTLIQMSGNASDAWLARQATDALARSGDPRGRRTVRELATSEQAAAEVRVAAMSALAGEYATPDDADALIRAYPALSTDRLRDAALGSIGGIGGAASRRFLLGVVKDESHAARQRRKAATLLDRAGVPVRDVIGAYDAVSDGEVRVQLIEVMAQAGTRDAMNKLVAIARDDTQLNARRRAISHLGKSEDPAVREALKGMVAR